ncbi:unnamed protein product [Arabidopsis arenosa]|uniref:Patellin-6 n=1 Tax=Arabidopsis arenosa TaxID=38785 RepID=A0A8S2AM35_ARAAE|nr:unnamed protein product [Arabidopsis arenosa]
MDASLSPFDHQKTQNTEPKKSFITSLITLRSNNIKEDTYFVSELKPTEQKSLQELKEKLKASSSKASSMWGVSLLGGDDKADVILLKFLRARDFKVADSLRMLEKCLEWREEFKAEKLTEEDLGFKDLEGKVAYMRGYDKEGHPVCYNAYDLKDMPKRELRVASNQILSLFQDNYPEMVATKIFINVPWYFSVIYSMFSPFLTHRTKSKFVMSKEGNAAETLYKFIRPEDIPVQYGGLSRPTDSQNGPPKPASEFSIKGGEKVNIQIEGIEGGATITWDIVVGGWDLEYSAEFVPNAEESYTIVVEKPKKMKASDEAVCNSFTTVEAGKLILSVDNTLSRKKKVAAYRYTVRKSTTTA